MQSSYVADAGARRQTPVRPEAATRSQNDKTSIGIYIYRLKWTSRSSMHYRCSTRWSNLSQGSHMENKKQHANFPALQGLTHSGDTHLDNRSEVLSKQKKTYARNAGTRENTLQRYETNALQRTAPSKLLKRGQRLLDTHH